MSVTDDDKRRIISMTCLDFQYEKGKRDVLLFRNQVLLFGSQGRVIVPPG